jgi:hypothetical protein
LIWTSYFRLGQSYNYLAAGKAILATRIPAHTDVFDDECALLVDPAASELAEGLRVLVGDRPSAKIWVKGRDFGASSSTVASTIASAYWTSIRRFHRSRDLAVVRQLIERADWV